MGRKKLIRKDAGVSLVEALVSAAVVGLGFAAIYSLSNVSTNILINAIDREKNNMVSTQVFEDLVTDPGNILEYNNLDFLTSSTGNNSWDKRQNAWKQSSESILTPDPEANDRKFITVEQKQDPDGNNIYVINLEIVSRNGKSKNYLTNIMNAPLSNP